MQRKDLNKFPKISIITPSYNQGHFIEEAIKSVLVQDYSNFQHIIIDNSSTDNTTEILNNYKHIFWISEPDMGQSDALNKGFRLAQGEIVGWLNSDERYLPGCFQKVSSFFSKNPKTNIAYGDCRWINEAGQVTQMRKELDFDLFLLKYHHVLSISTVATFFSRSIFDQRNFLKLNYNYAMDYEFFLRLAMQNYRFEHINEFLGDFRWHKDCKSDLSSGVQFFEREKALMEHDPFLQRINNKKVRKWIRKCLMSMAKIKRYSLKSIKGYYFTQWKQ